MEAIGWKIMCSGVTLGFKAWFCHFLDQQHEIILLWRILYGLHWAHTHSYSLNCLETCQTKGLLQSSFDRWEHWGLNYLRHHPRSKPGFSSTKAIPNHDIIMPINSTYLTHFLRIVFLKKIIVSLLFHSNKFWGEQW